MSDPSIISLVDIMYRGSVPDCLGCVEEMLLPVSGIVRYPSHWYYSSNFANLMNTNMILFEKIFHIRGCIFLPNSSQDFADPPNQSSYFPAGKS